jgi:hypothetical protein
MKRLTGQDRSITSKWRPATQAVRGGTARSHFGETSEAIFLTSGYAYDCANMPRTCSRIEPCGLLVPARTGSERFSLMGRAMSLID